MVEASTVQVLVLDERLGRREVGAEPDMALAAGEIELGARFRADERRGVLHAAIAHDAVGHAVLDDLQLGPAFDALVADHGAAGRQRAKKKGSDGSHLRECSRAALPAERTRPVQHGACAAHDSPDGIIRARPVS